MSLTARHTPTIPGEASESTREALTPGRYIEFSYSVSLQNDSQYRLITCRFFTWTCTFYTKTDLQ